MVDVRYDPVRLSYSFTDYKAPLTMNQIRGMHWRPYSDHIDVYQQAFGLPAKSARVPQLDVVEIIVRHTYRKDKPDTLACAPAVKAAIDGLVKVGVLIDDSPEFVRDIRFQPPKKTGVDSLELEVIPIGVSA